VTLLREFQGWTPDTIDNLTFEQLNAILRELDKTREVIPSPDVSLAELSNAFLAFLGVKRKKVRSSENLTEKLKNTSMPVIKWNKEEKEKYFEEGMPGPPSEWLKKYRKNKNG